jgi:LysM repeat protein
MSGMHVAGKSRLARVTGIVVLVLMLWLLVACKPRLVYEETPTAEPQVAPSLTPTPIVPTLTPIPTPTPTMSGPTMLRLEPSVVNLTVGETGLVRVVLDNVEQLHSIELHISFEPGYANIEDANPDVDGVQVEAGTILMPAQVIQNEANNGTGLIVYHVAQEAQGSTSGSGVVASFTVKALAEGGSPLRFNVANLRDSAGEPLPPLEPIDGLVTIGAGSAASAPTTEPAPTEAPPTAAPSVSTPMAATATPVPAPTSPPTAGGIYHTVQRGENLYRIALRYGTSVDAIVAANNLTNPNAVKAGQVLLIPATSPAGTTSYVVQPGDTLYSIARRFGKSYQTLAAQNGITPPYTIKVGQTLVIAP